MIHSDNQSPSSERTAKRYWKSLDEWAENPEFLAAAQKEFSPGAQWWLDKPSRRAFLQRMGASLALAGLTGCGRQPHESIYPYVETPETLVPGVPLSYATAMPQPGGAIGLVVKSHEGRPVKVDGNSLHPSSLGGTDSQAQASVLDLYDPHRMKVVHYRGRISSWSDFLTAFLPQIEREKARQGSGLHIVTGSILSPTLKSQIQALVQSMPSARLYSYEPAASTAVQAGTQLAFGAPLIPQYHLSRADVIFSVDSDFLGDGPEKARIFREFSGRRRVPASGRTNMSRIYVTETVPSGTGAVADHWLPLPEAELSALLLSVARKLGVDVSAFPSSSVALTESQNQWSDVLVEDLQSAGERSAVLVGSTQPAEVQALVHVINDRLGNVGTTVQYLPSVEDIENVAVHNLTDLAQAIDQGAVETLLVCNVDLLYSAPSDLDLATRVSKVPFTVSYSSHHDKTVKACTWNLPATHYLEEWSDTVAADGTTSLIQPLIAPLYEGKSLHEIFNILLGAAQQPGYETVRNFWLQKFGAGNETRWEKSLHDGIVAETQNAPVAVSLQGNAVSQIAELWQPIASATGDAFHVTFRPDPSLFDGRYTTNSWLQELPKPFSKMVWGNAAWISLTSANELGLKNGDVIELQRDQAKISLPVWIQPGQPKNTLTVFLGHGREVDGAEVHGTDVYPLRSTASMWHTRVTVKKSGKNQPLVVTQHHHDMMGRDIIRHGTLEEFQKDPEHASFMHPHHHGPTFEGPNPTLFPEKKLEGPQWGMTINLTACTGCNACVVACQSENNIPVVGPDQVSRGREMHWLRIDSYFTGDPESETPEVYSQPVSCMHCEHAPCEPVCPVGATTHSDDGLNEMTYNRCIGTRYCSNNCPYKVRRFNFLDYNKDTKGFPVLQMLQNPEVTVRSRGVMEKCTYCVQKISSARIQASMENREIRDGEIVTACQSVCAAQAISFGNVADPKSTVSSQKKHPLNYGLLDDELNTRPRTSYLAAIRNPNPKLAVAQEHAHA